MKKSKFILAGGILFSLVAFQGCQNCDEAVKAAHEELEGKLAEKDSLIESAKTELETIRADYEARLTTLDSMLQATSAQLGAAKAKKPAPPKPTTPQKPKVTTR